MKWLVLVVILSCVLAAAVRKGQANPAPEQQATGSAGITATVSSQTLPKDVFPDSRNRLPLVKREELDDQGKKAYDASTSDPRLLAGLQGPAGIRLHSPRLADPAQAARYLRFETDLGRRLSELAILVTAREMDEQFEWTSHEPEGRKQGLEQAVIDVVKYRKPLTGLGEKEAAIIQVGREVFGKHFVASETYAQAVKLFGERNVMDLAGLMGDQAGNAVILTAFDQHLPPGQKPLLPMP